MDPELAGSAKASGASAGGAGEEVISDPELGESRGGGQDFGWGQVYKPEPEPTLPKVEEEEYDPLANTGMAKLEILSQVAVDMRHEGDLEDAYESRLRLGGEIEFRRSRKLRLVLGSRVDFFWAVPAEDDPYLVRLKRDPDGNPIKDKSGGFERYHERAIDEDRFEVDVIPTAAYLDTTLADGLHLRLGDQVINLGRMDFYAPTDILAIYDLRPQPRTDLAVARLPQPAVRIDWDMTSWMTLQAVYVPWFSPNLMRPNRDLYTASVIGGRGAAQIPGKLDGLIDPSYQTKQSEANLRFVAPPPDFSNPQAEARLNFRGSVLEFALSAGTALEKMPMVYTTPTFDLYARKTYRSDAEASLGSAVQKGLQVVDVEYHRYYLVGFDGTFDISPVSVSFEFGYSPSRHLYAATANGSHIVQPNVSTPIVDPNIATRDPGNVTDRSIRKGVPVVQGAMHVEWLKGESFVFVGEAFWINALELPYDRTRDWWGFIPKTGAYVGGLVATSYLVDEGHWRFDVSAVTGVGPSIALVPNVELRAKDNLFVNVGAQIIEGPAPGFNGAQNVNFGGLLSGYDQVFVGLRWLP